MVVVGQIVEDDMVLSGCSLYALDGNGKVRGYKKSVDEDGTHLIFMVVHGNEMEDIHFRAVMGTDCDVQTYDFADTMIFQDGERMGSPTQPYRFDLSNITGIDGINHDSALDDIYSIGGIRVKEPTAPGIYISGGKKMVRTDNAYQ